MNMNVLPILKNLNGQEIWKLIQIGNCFVANTFIGNNVYFSDYEERKAAEYANRKPTKNVEDLLKTDESDQNSQSNAADEDDIDFEGLLND